ncbi:MAG TPA: nucleotidyltransferase substrate binding protein [Candidatus Cloacimonadota bacterium]|nr:nucleotidyltransferase substrate binding protein [Candidatus Cloacimonadota bacterium]
MEQDIRWIQRLSNYEKAFNNLSKAVELATVRDLSDLEKQGLIQSFEFTFELAWNVIKDFFENQGETSIYGSKDAFRMAFRRGLITKGDYLMESIKSRQLTSHTYHEETANKIYHNIIDKYHEAFEELLIVLKREAGKN